MPFQDEIDHRVDDRPPAALAPQPAPVDDPPVPLIMIHDRPPRPASTTGLRPASPHVGDVPGAPAHRHENDIDSTTLIIQDRRRGEREGARIELRWPHRSDRRRVRRVVRRPAASRRGRTERRRRAARRHRVRPTRLLRLRHRHDERRRTSGQWRAVHQLPRHPAVLADACIAAHRPQPARRRHARRLQLANRVPTPTRPRLERRGNRRRGAPRRRVRHVLRRQVAPRADGRVLGGRTVRPVAAGTWLRPLLRLPRGRDRPVPPGPGVRQPPHRPATDAGGGLPPQRGPRRPTAADDPRRQGRAAGPTVLRVPPLRRHSRPPSGARRVPRPVPRSLRRGMGRGAPAVVRRASSSSA